MVLQLHMSLLYHFKTAVYLKNLESLRVLTSTVPDIPFLIFNLYSVSEWLSGLRHQTQASASTSAQISLPGCTPISSRCCPWSGPQALPTKPVQTGFTVFISNPTSCSKHSLIDVFLCLCSLSHGMGFLAEAQ